MFENLLNSGVTLISVISVMALFISIVTQLTKEFIPKVIPTKLYVLVISVISTVVGVLCYLQYKGLEIKFYIVIGSVALGFFVAFISMYGWDEFKELKDRFVKK